MFPAARDARELGSSPVRHLLFEIFVALLRVLAIVLRRPSFVRAIAIKLGVVTLDRMEVGSLGCYPESASRSLQIGRNAPTRVDVDRSLHRKA
jgi:hypothetical protein